MKKTPLFEAANIGIYVYHLGNPYTEAASNQFLQRRDKAFVTWNPASFQFLRYLGSVEWQRMVRSLVMILRGLSSLKCPVTSE